MGGLKQLSLVALLSQAFAAPPTQVALLDDGGSVQNVVKQRPLHGKFLHITGELLAWFG